LLREGREKKEKGEKESLSFSSSLSEKELLEGRKKDPSV